MSTAEAVPMSTAAAVRCTACLDPELQQALRLNSVQGWRSRSELVNDAALGAA